MEGRPNKPAATPETGSVNEPPIRVRRFFRIVLTNPPTERDFTSNLARGFRPPTTDLETVRLWAGLSVYDQRRYARKVALRAPRLGAFLAELHVPENTGIQFERTTKSHGHYTLWGDPAHLLSFVVDVTTVSETWELE